MSTPDTKNKQPKKVNLSREAIDFQPDAVEISMRPLPWWARHGILWGVLLFICAIIAAYVGKVDMIVDGPGKLISGEPNIVMKPLDRSIVKKVHVKVGDLVEKDEVLISFDPEINQKELNRLQGEYSSVEAQAARWKAETEKHDYAIGDKPNGDQLSQYKIFSQRTKFFNEKIKTFDEAVKQLKINIDDTKNKIMRRNNTLTKQKSIVDEYERLLKSNAISVKEYSDAFNQYNATLTEIESLESAIIELGSKVLKENSDRATFIAEWEKDTAEKEVQAALEANKIKNSLEKVEKLTTYTEIRSPRRAIVHEIASFPEGSAVREAEALITLIPIDCEIELEAKIPASDIGKIKKGQDVRVKLNPFPFQKHGTLNGDIRTISEDTFKPDQGQQGPDYYKVRISLSGKLKNVHKDFRLIPGMECQTEIKVGKRSVIEYVLNPLTKALDEAITEP